MSTGRALGTMAALVVVIGLFLMLTAAAGVTQGWAGFLFLLQWGMMETLRLERLPHSALGAIGGVLIASIPALLAPLVGGGVALAIMLTLVAVATFALMRGLGGLVFNAATMLFLTVVSIPPILAVARPAAVLIGLLAGVGYFGGGVALGALISRRRARAASG